MNERIGITRARCKELAEKCSLNILYWSNPIRLKSGVPSQTPEYVELRLSTHIRLRDHFHMLSVAP